MPNRSHIKTNVWITTLKSNCIIKYEARLTLSCFCYTNDFRQTNKRCPHDNLQLSVHSPLSKLNIISWLIHISPRRCLSMCPECPLQVLNPLPHNLQKNEYSLWLSFWCVLSSSSLVQNMLQIRHCGIILSLLSRIYVTALSLIGGTRLLILALLVSGSGSCQFGAFSLAQSTELWASESRDE